MNISAAAAAQLLVAAAVFIQQLYDVLVVRTRGKIFRVWIRVVLVLIPFLLPIHLSPP